MFVRGNEGVNSNMQPFTVENLLSNDLAQTRGYWSREVAGRKHTYTVSITRDTANLYTIACFQQTQKDAQGFSKTQVHIAGHLASLYEAVDMANELATNLSKHDLFVSLRNSFNGVGVRVLAS